MSEEFIMLDFSKTCRTCLAQDNNMHPLNNSIKTAQNNYFVIKDMLWTCAQIQVTDDDGLPSQVCLKCVCRVSDAYLFKQNCEKSQNTLREYISNKLNDVSSQIIQNESVNCDKFKDNVMNLINIAVDEANGLDQDLIANNEQVNKIDNESHSLHLLENNANNRNIQNTHIPHRKRRKITKKIINVRPQKVMKIAPKSPLNSVMPYSDRGKFITINISGNSVIIGDKPAKLTKLPENIDIKGQCKLCGIYFIYESELNLHLKDVHHLNDSSEPIKYICSICNIEFPMYDKLNEHNVLEHYKDAALQCDECHNYYSNKLILNRHKRIAHGNMIGELSCDMCPKRFDSVRGLSIHKAFHNVKTAENKISCKICDRTFNVMANLTYHMKYHKTGVCQYCNHGFCNTSMMKDHMKSIHAGDKPYHCSYCNKKFNIRKVLLKHKRLAHGVYDDIYFCGVCKNNNVGFITHEFLLKHIQKYHKLPENISMKLPKDTGLKCNDAVEENHPKDVNAMTNDSQSSFINLPDIAEKATNSEDTLCSNKDLSFENSLTNSNLSQLIDLTNEVNSSQITLNDDGTINISINDTQVQNIQVSEAADESLITTQDFSFGEAIENTIKVLKQEIFNDHKNENNFSVTEMGEYTINEINTDENNIEENINNVQDVAQPSEQNLEFNDPLMPGKIIHYDEENQQYTISYDGAEYIISANSLNQTNNIHYEVPETEKFDNVDADSNEKDDSEHLEQQIRENDEDDEDITNNLICKLCNISFIDQTSYNNHVPKHNKAAKGLDTLISQQESAVENSNDIKEGMIRINVNNVTGIVTHERTDLIFAKEDYNSAPEAEEADNVDVPRYRCPKCDDLFTRQYSLNRHLAHTHNELCLVCNTCGEGFNRVSLLEEHRLKHKNMLNMGVIITSVEKPATSVSNETQSAIHEITESLYVYEPENQSFPCEFCDKTFQRQIYLERHRVVHLGINQPGFMCSTCNKIFLTAVDMQKHKRKHNEEYLQCNLCDRTFTTLGGLKYHLKTHTGTKNHKCPFCGKKFTANINLNAHIKTVHSEVKPHLCNICGKRYTTSDHLRKHMVYHTGERKFQCGVCSKDFTQNSHLRQHSWIHSGIKPYACKYCDNKYTSSTALKKHMHNNHTS